MNRSLTWALICLLSGSGSAWAEDTLKRIKHSASISIGVRESSGLSFAAGQGVYSGFHVELCRRLLLDVQKQLGLPKLDVRYQVVSAQNRMALMQSGVIDLECGSTTNTQARQKEVAFSVTTYVEEVRMLVKAGSGINAIHQLDGRTVATTTGTTSVQTLRRHERAKGVDFREVFGRDHADSFLLLESGRADAFVMDGSVLASIQAKAKHPGDYRIVGEVLSVEPVALMMRKDDPAFKKTIDDGIKAMIKSGEMMQLWDKWFQQALPGSQVKVGLSLNENTRSAWAQPNDRPMEDYAKR